MHPLIRRLRGAFSYWKRRILSYLPNVKRYDLLTAELSPDPHTKLKAPTGYEIKRLDTTGLEEIELGRPGYSPRAERYFNEGHEAFGVVDESSGRIVALGWVFSNETPTSQRVKDYFVVEPKEGYLHAAWTHPDHRGKGLQTLLVATRLEHLHKKPGIATAVTNIESDLIVSQKAVAKAGFTKSATLLVWGPRRTAQKRNTRLPIRKGRLQHA